MKFYVFDRQQWFPTLGAAHEEARKVEPVYRSNVRIVETDIPTDKESLLTLLNTGVPTGQAEGRTWTLTSRGGLKELVKDEQ